MKPQIGVIGGLWIIFTIINRSFSQIERDIVLKPNLALEIKGKTLFYNPSDDNIKQNKTVIVPWERTLKHLTYLTLNNQVDENPNNLSKIPEYNRFLQSPYVQSNEYIPKFGDIITLAKGRLEQVKKDEYRFIEGQCTKKCSEEAQHHAASWIVQKIRHRDADRKFRYEIKFSVSPNISNKSDSKREIGKRKIRAFVLKDDDYPNNFVNLDQHIALRKSDDFDSYRERLIKFNDIFSQPRHFQSRESTTFKELPDLNIGEYIPSPHLLHRAGVPPPARVIFPTTYRPAYHAKAPKPPYDSPTQKYSQYSLNSNERGAYSDPVATTHLHHHYYVPKPQMPDSYTSVTTSKEILDYHYIPDHRGAIDIIERPLKRPYNTGSHEYHTPTPISNQIPIPPNMNGHIQITQTPYPVSVTNPIIQPPPLLYMPAIPVSPHIPGYAYPRNEGQESSYNRHVKPFIESPKDDSVRYSDPDPLYHSVTLNTVETIPAQITEITSPAEIENPATDSEEISSEERPNGIPDSINAQLPPPDLGQDTLIPYVETSIETQTSASALKQFSVANSIESSSEVYSTSTTIYDSTSKKQTGTIQPSSTSTASTTSTISTTFQPITAQDTKSDSEEFQLATTLEFSKEEDKSQEELDEKITNISTTEDTSTKSTTKFELKPNLFPKRFPTKPRSYHRSTTERPILKWKPKRTKLTKISPSASSTNQKYEFEAIPINFTEKVITVTPEPKGEDVQTKQSVSTSISIKVGTEEDERPFIPTINIPNVELYRADFKPLETNSSNIRLYMASDTKGVLETNTKEKPEDKKERMELTKSIVEHVQSLK